MERPDGRRFEDLVRSHHAAVYRAAHRVVGAADAEDVVQQVFARLLAGRVRLRAGDDAESTLRWVAVRLARNHDRSRRRRRHHEEERAKMRDERNDDAPADELAERDLRSALRRAVEALPEDQRLPLVLHYWERMSFASLGQALQCSASTVHGHVQRGLDAVRRRLRDAGFAAVALDVPHALAAAAPAPAAVPARLADQVLEATPTAIGAGLGAKLALAAVVLLGGGVAWWQLDARGAAAPSPALGSEAATAAVALGAPAAGAPTVAADLSPSARRAVTPGAREAVVAPPVVGGEDFPRGTVRGLVLAAADGAPLADAEVLVASMEFSGKETRFAERGRTDAAGRFAVDVPVAYSAGQAYAVHARLQDHVGDPTGSFRVTAGGVVDAPAVHLRRLVDDREGAWTMVVQVLDGGGRALPDAIVVVERVATAPAGAGRLPDEARAQTDAVGIAALAGGHLGEKRLRVTPPVGSGLTPAVVRIAVADAGPHRHSVTLDRGLTITGTVALAESLQPVRGLPIAAARGSAELASAVSDEQGRFELAGLVDEPVTLRTWSVDYSDFEIADVRPGTQGLVLLVKRSDDPRPLGLHLGELHGRIVDARNGEPVDVSEYAIRTFWLDPAVPYDPDEVLPGLIVPPPVQVMARAVSDSFTRAIEWVEPVASTFHATGLGEGRYLMLAWADGYAVGRAGPFDVGPGRLCADIVVALERGAAVSGRVVDASGRPVAGALVHLAGRATGRSVERGDGVSDAEHFAVLARRSRPSHRTDTDGRFRFEHLPSGCALSVCALTEDGHRAETPRVRLTDGEHRELGELRLR
ncbi:MAG: sigma-70 family RNA polymerase sigma factor [Planctomycetes bacterium]|nr:sigma-70 family RNA polymerase sigma factor [Planctomycetota bacterium]